jgi:hypothetical protein
MKRILLRVRAIFGAGSRLIKLILGAVPLH